LENSFFFSDAVIETICFSCIKVHCQVQSWDGCWEDPLWCMLCFIPVTEKIMPEQRSVKLLISHMCIALTNLYR